MKFVIIAELEIRNDETIPESIVAETLTEQWEQTAACEHGDVLSVMYVREIK